MGMTARQLREVQATFSHPNVQAVFDRFRGRIVTPKLVVDLREEVLVEIRRSLEDFAGIPSSMVPPMLANVCIARHRDNRSKLALAFDFQFDGADDPTGEWEKVS